MNLTKLNKPVVRGTGIKVGDSTLTVGFLPPGTLSMKLKGERRTTYIDLKKLYLKETKDVQASAPIKATKALVAPKSTEVSKPMVVKAKEVVAQAQPVTVETIGRGLNEPEMEAFVSLASELGGTGLGAIIKAYVAEKSKPISTTRRRGMRTKLEQSTLAHA